MSRDDVRPTAMKAFEDEDRADSSVSKTERRVKIEINHTWMIRLLPVKMGKAEQYYVRLAQHWWNKSPMYCPRYLAPAWGGDPDYSCPVCAVSERLQESSSQLAKDIGYDARVQLRRKMWCVVFDMEDARGRVEEMTLEEILNPYTIEMTKTTWQDFKKFQAWAARRKGGSDLGILDLETGCNLLATHTSKGVRLDRQDAGPIFEINDPEWDNKIARIWSRLRQPSIVIPTEDQLLQLSMKIEEEAEGNGRRRNRGRSSEDEDDRGGRGRFRNRSRNDDDENDDRGSHNRRRSGEDEDDEPAPHSRRGRSDDREEGEAGPSRRREEREREQEREPEDRASTASPTRRRRSEPESESEQSPTQEEASPQTTPPPRRSATAPSGPPPARRQQAEAQSEGVSGEDLDRDQQPNPSPPPKRSATAGPPSARQQQPTSENNGGDTSPQNPPTRRASSGPPSGQNIGVDDDEDNAPAEKHDPAPPVRSQVEETPPPVSASAPPLRRGTAPTENTADLKKRLDNLSTRR